MKKRNLKKINYWNEKKKILIVISAIITSVILFMGLIIGMDRYVEYNVKRLYKDVKETDNNYYQMKHGIVLGLNSKRDQYNRRVANYPFGTGNIYIEDQDNLSYSISVGLICYQKKLNDKKTKMKLGRCSNTVIFASKEREQLYVVPKTGKYKIELWGAGGGNAYALANRYNKAGKGAYTSGIINLKKGEKLYFYVGSKGEDSKIIEDWNRLTIFYYPSSGGAGGYNGGGTGAFDPQTDAGGGGGGATDVRLLPGKWNDFDSLKSRIMVAGAGGGMSRYFHAPDSGGNGLGRGGNAGVLQGENASTYYETDEKTYNYGSTQTGGYQFGIGQNGIYCETSSNGLGGGAGGYYGSYTGYCPSEMFWMPTGAGGGSSYVSGCKGCNAIDQSSNENEIKHTGQPNHYSGKIFSDIVMKSGSESMLDPFGKKIDGNSKNGYAKITYIG